MTLKKMEVSIQNSFCRRLSITHTLLDSGRQSVPGDSRHVEAPGSMTRFLLTRSASIKLFDRESVTHLPNEFCYGSSVVYGLGFPRETGDYLLECALNVASAVERDVQKIFPRAGRVAHEDTMMDDDGQYIHLVGPGKYVEVQETFVGDKLHVLQEFLRGIGRTDISAALQMASRPVSVRVF
jgi:hypothetical protein